MSADWLIRSGVIAAIAVIDALWLWAKGITFVTAPLNGPLALSAMLFLWCLATPLLIAARKELATVLVGTTDFFYSFIQMTLMVVPVATLTYLAATMNLPLVDPLLSRADALLGFDWTAVDAWVSSHAAVDAIFSRSYGTIFWQPFATIFLVSVGRPGSTNSDLIWGMLLCVFICSVFSALVPALGYEGAIGAAHIDALREIRAGAWTTLDTEKVEGIITFPSFHAALGVLFPYALRHIRWAFWPALLMNGTMILGTPVIGGHYLVDVIAGVLVAAFSILLLRAIRRRTARMRLDHSGSVMGALELALGRKK